MLRLVSLLVCAGLLAASQAPKLEGDVGAGEGPAWSPQNELFFTGDGRIYRRDAKGTFHVFRDQPNGANGLVFDLQGRLIACEVDNRRITRTELDGSVTVLADNFEGARFNSPNDLTIDRKGRVYFSDPRYGRREGMEIRDEQGRTIEGVYRIDAPGKVARILAGEVSRPNGLLVSPDDRHLYVADNLNNETGGARKLWRFDLRDDGSVDRSSKKLIFDWRDGRGPDGIKADQKGQLYVAAGRTRPNQYESADTFKGGVYVLTPEGKQIDFIAIPDDEVTNCAFGGDDRRTLYITAGGKLWSVRVDTPGFRR